MSARPFEEFVRGRAEADFVERRWLHENIASALESESCRFVLVTGEPGAGKTGLISRMAVDHDKWLRYLVGQHDGVSYATGDVTSFLLSVGHQLARQYPEAFDMQRLQVIVDQRVGTVGPGGEVIGIRIDDLTVSPFFHTASLEVEQRADLVEGSLTGAAIGSVHLEPRLQDPVNLIHLALIDPATVLLEMKPDARIVVLLDALDTVTRSETGDALLDLLSGRDGVGLPANVQLVITSRPDRALGLLRTGRAGQLTEVRVDPADREVGDDLNEYAGRALATPEIDRAVQAVGMMPDQFRRQVARHASGNFQYLASYTRAFNDAVTDNNGELVGKLLQLDSFPSDLDGIYAFFAEIARVEIERLRELEIEHPLSDTDRVTPAWEGVGQPVLGTLTVTREPLGIDQLIQLSGVRVWRRLVRDVLGKLRWLLDMRDDQRIAFYHPSVGEFLASDRAARDCPDSWIDETEWHERIARHYRGAADTWAGVDWEATDRYGLEYLAYHIERSRPDAADELVSMVCPGLLQTIRRRFGTERRFLDLTDLAAASVATRAAREQGAAKALTQVMYLSVIRDQAARDSHAAPPKVLGLLARRGRLREALDMASALSPSMRKFAATLEIFRYARPGTGDPSADELLEVVVEAALAYDQNSRDADNGTSFSRPWFAMQTAARMVAPHDVERGLRLWRHGQESRNGPGKDGEAPDAIYATASRAEADIGRARALADSIRGSRIDAYVHIAGRADLVQAAEMLKAVEADLSGLGSGQRLHGLGRLAAAWKRCDAAQTDRLLAQMRAEIFTVATDQEFAENIAEAASLVSDVAEAAALVSGTDQATARMFLASLDMIESGVYGASGFKRAITLWRKLGEPGRAQALAERLAEQPLTPKSRSWTGFRLGLVDWDTLDRAEAIRLIEEMYAEIPDAAETYGSMESSDRNSRLGSIAMAFARYDARRAAEVAGEISEVSWSGARVVSSDLDVEGFPTFGGAFDRCSVLAEIAHQCLDRGDEDDADTLLEQGMRHAQAGASPGVRQDDSKLYVRASDPVPSLNSGKASEEWVMRVESPRGDSPPVRKASLDGLQLLWNLESSWTAYAKRQFYSEPADYVRSVARGPYGLARLVRVMAEQQDKESLRHAVALTRTIADPGERAIGLAALQRATHEPGDQCTPASEALSRELDLVLAEVEKYRWTFHADGIPPDPWGFQPPDYEPWAYWRPDHRVWFEVAVRSTGCRNRDKDPLKGLPVLMRALVAGIFSWASRYYVSEVLAGRQPHPEFGRAHERTLCMDDDGDVLLSIAIAQAARQQFRLREAVPEHRPFEVRPQISDVRYAAVIDLVTPGPGEPLSAKFTTKVESLIGQGKLAAVGGLLAFCTKVRPDYLQELRGLAERTAAAAESVSPASRVQTLSLLVSCPAFAGLPSLDPVRVLRMYEQCKPDGHDFFGFPGVPARLFPALLARHPDIALAQLYRAGWGFSMSLLESAVSAPAAGISADLASPLASAIQRALRCVARDGSTPKTFDGVDIERLAALATDQDRNPRL